MTPNRLRVAASFLAIIAVAGALAGCGRRGPLEPPPSAAVLSTDEEGNTVSEERGTGRPFILDSLIQ